ncbi:unnamed protein product [Polarella glacialis]|uniref:Large ribosomal subunit protein uL4c n=1 Tax=Polarella glacialis TaxID=89957 RepID=A0A813KGS9_POLGL|nr:unnamed protein product [Polarella glacialis]
MVATRQHSRLAAAAGVVSAVGVVSQFVGSLSPSFVQLPQGPEVAHSSRAQRFRVRGAASANNSRAEVGGSPIFGAAAGALGAVAASMLAAGTRARKAAVARRATPEKHMIPVVDLKGKQVGEEELQFNVFSRETANYVVHQAHTIWAYQQIKHTEYHPRRSDVKKGMKPYKQKGTGRARQGSRYSPLYGKVATNKLKHGLDNKRKMKLLRNKHTKAISTVLQSKWKNMKIVVGLEDLEEPRYYDMTDMIKDVTGRDAGYRSTLLIARGCYGKEHPIRCVPTYKSYRSPLYMAGRLIDKFQMRRPRDIDAKGDGLHQCLLARKLIVSREAFFDLKSKFGVKDGWAFMEPEQILVSQMQKLVKDFPYDRMSEWAEAREVPRAVSAREFWAKDKREEEAKKLII